MERFRVFWCAVFAGALAGLASAAVAQSIDPAAYTCQEYTAARASSDPHESLGAELMVAWLAGRATPDGPNARIDVSAAAAKTKALDGICRKTPEATLNAAFLPIAEPDAGSADALTRDELTCEDVQLSSIEDVESLAAIVFWLAGHFSQADPKARIETGALERYIARIGDTCRKSKDTPLADAAQEAFKGH